MQIIQKLLNNYNYFNCSDRTTSNYFYKYFLRFNYTNKRTSPAKIRKIFKNCNFCYEKLIYFRILKTKNLFRNRDELIT